MVVLYNFSIFYLVLTERNNPIGPTDSLSLKLGF